MWCNLGYIFLAPPSELSVRSICPVYLTLFSTCVKMSAQAKDTGEVQGTHAKANPPEQPLRGVLCLLALAMSFKPLVDIAANYARCERHKETGEDFQATHLLPVASMEKGSGRIISEVVRIFNSKLLWNVCRFSCIEYSKQLHHLLLRILIPQLNLKRGSHLCEWVASFYFSY